MSSIDMTASMQPGRREDVSVRGADIVMRSLRRAGCRTIFALSGNHIMALFDAAIETDIEIVHVRHEAAAVHMADAWARLTGEPGIALVTGGPGHGNALGALTTALGEESPVVLLSGLQLSHEVVRSGFEGRAQADMAAPVTKAAWVAQTVEGLAEDIRKALAIALEGRPGPVHLSLPVHLLDETVEERQVAWSQGGDRPPSRPDAAAAASLGQAIASASRPILIAGPSFSGVAGRTALEAFEAAAHVPTCILNTARGLGDASFGALRPSLKEADLVVLMGKALDFSLDFGRPPLFDSSCRWAVVSPDAETVRDARDKLGERFALGIAASAPETLAVLTDRFRAAPAAAAPSPWHERIRAGIAQRYGVGQQQAGRTAGRVHPAEVFNALKPYVQRDPDAVLVIDGGEFPQWAAALLDVPRRLVTGLGGAIGVSIPFALAARLVEPVAPIFVAVGDGAFGFHLSEFETAIRRGLPFVALVGNDARWNAESQLQVRKYGRQRARGCELEPARYDLVVESFGGHGEFVTDARDLDAAIARALASNKPACVNVQVESVPAPRLGAVAPPAPA